DLQTYSAKVGPESKGARPCFPESGQRPRQWGNQDGASCHAHNISESNNRPTPGEHRQVPGPPPISLHRPFGAPLISVPPKRVIKFLCSRTAERPHTNYVKPSGGRNRALHRAKLLIAICLPGGPGRGFSRIAEQSPHLSQDVNSAVSIRGIHS